MSFIARGFNKHIISIPTAAGAATPNNRLLSFYRGTALLAHWRTTSSDDRVVVGGREDSSSVKGMHITADGRFVHGSAVDAWLASTLGGPDSYPVNSGPSQVSGSGGHWVEEGTLLVGKREAFESANIVFDDVTQVAGLATGTVNAGHGLAVGVARNAYITNVPVVEYNGFKNLSVPDATTVTWAVDAGLSAAPGAGGKVRLREPLDPIGAGKFYRYILTAGDHQAVWAGINPTHTAGEKAQSAGALGVLNAANEMNLTLFTHGGPGGAGTNAALAIDREVQNVMMGGNLAAPTAITDPRLTAKHSRTGAAAIRGHASSASFVNNVVEAVGDRTSSALYNLFAGYSGGVPGTGNLEFRVTAAGEATAEGAFTGGGADYAIATEFEDGNPPADPGKPEADLQARIGGRNRVGWPVVMVGAKARLAVVGDDPTRLRGVVAWNSAVVENAGISWHGKFARDGLGREILEEATELSWWERRPGTDELTAEVYKLVRVWAYSDRVPEGVAVPEDATRTLVQRPKWNPDYDPKKEFVEPLQRPEWFRRAKIGLVVIDRRAIVMGLVHPNWEFREEFSPEADVYEL